MNNNCNHLPSSFFNESKRNLYLDLFHTRSLKSEIKAVVGECPHLGVVPVITHADDGDVRGLDEGH